MGGAINLNFEVRLRGKIIILKILKKYHENQREKLILMILGIGDTGFRLRLSEVDSFLVMRNLHIRR
jgi:hypothetical protein